MATEQHTLEMIVGTTLRRIFRFKDENGDPFDLSDYNVSISVRRNLSCREPFIKVTDDTETENGSSLTIDNTGEVFLEINYKETSKILSIYEKQEYVWDIRLEDQFGKVYVYFPSSPFIIYPASSRGG